MNDVVLVADSERKLQLAVMEWVKTLKEKGVRLNLTESRVMMIARTEDRVARITVTWGKR